MKNKNFIGRLRCLLFLMVLASFNYLSAQTGPNDDFDGDGIINSIDIDDDNDGILDTAEGVSFSNNTIVNGNFGTDTATGGNLTGWTTNGSGANLTTSFNWFATSGAAASFADGVEGINLSQDITLKTAATLYTSIFTVKVLGLNGSGVGLANGWGKMSFWIQGTAGLVKLFTVYNPQTANLNSPTSDIIEINSTVVKKLSINGNSSASSFANGSYSTIQLTLDTSQLATTGQILILRSNGAANGPNGQVGADDFFIDDLSYQYEYGIDTDNSGIQNQFNLDSDGDGCSDALEGGATNSVTPNYKFTGPVGANGLDNTLETADNGIVNYTSTYSSYAIDATINACTDTDGDGIRDVIDIDDDNDGVLDTVEMVAVCNIAAATPTSVTVTPSAAWGPIASTIDNSGMIGTGLSATTNGPVTTANAWYGPDNVTTATIDYVTPAGSNASYVLLWATESNDGTTGGDGPIKDFTVTITYNNGANTFTTNTFTTVQPTGIGTPNYAQKFEFGQAFTNVTKISLNVLNGWYDSDTPAKNDAWVPTNTVTISTQYNLTLSEFRYGCYELADQDTDNDGIPNRLDLDSDGDGCPDAKEASVSVNPGAAASMSTSGGAIYTGGIPSGTANAYVGDGTPAEYGSNGLFNDIETGENGIYNGTYSYQYAINNALIVCIDTDGDGVGDLIDIDDDNDGVLDVLEQNCPNGSKTGVIVTKPAAITYTFNGNNLANLVDGIDSNIYVMYNPTPPAALSNAEWFRVEFPTARILSSWEVGHYVGQTLFSTTSTYKVQGSNDASVWTDLTGTLTYSRTQNGQSTQANNSNVANFSSNVTAYKYYRYFGIAGSVGTGWATEFYFTDGGCIDIDTDTDGIPNRLDLDSDGDGCPDALEAGVSSNSGATASMSTSGGGIYTGGIPSGTANAYVGNGTLSQYGANGFFNGIETAVDSGLYNSTYTYAYANTNVINLCADTDGDGVNDFVDIDDDNDGILDAIESPSCFYAGTEFESGNRNSFVTVTSGLNMTSPYDTPQELVDGDNGTAAANYAVNFVNSQSNVGTNIYTFEFFSPVKLSNIYLGYINGNSHFINGAVVKLQGSNNGSVWTDLNAGTTYNQANTSAAFLSQSAQNYQLFTVSQNAAKYKYYRIAGVSGTIWSGGYSNEAYFQVASDYIASSHPKLTCVSDTDGDGILNHLDLDSDGDGCSDAMEGGSTNSLAANYKFTGPVGTNGLDNSLETADNGIVNYVSTYNTYAINASIKACTDTDGDGVVDIIDIDDDNDGVLDVIEMGTCTSLLSSLVDGSFEAAAPVAWNENTNTGSLNSTMGATGWASTGSPDTWTGSFSLVGSGTWAGAMNGVPATPDGTVFAAIYNGFINEGITKNIPASQGIQVGHTYTVEFYQIFGGVNGVTPVGRQAQLRFTFDGVPYLSNTMTYNGNNVKQWEKTSITFTATTNAPVLAIDVVSTGDGNYIGIDGIVFYEQNTQGCGGVPLDTDNDGIPNHLDLDSDGDGCPDTKEAILYNHVTEASIAGDVKNGSGGAVTSTVNTPNAMVPGPYGSNGFADALQLSTNPDAYKYIYTYNFVADNMNVSTCDNKFLYDIDSDDDGIPDAVESPSCFYTEVQAMDITEGVSSDFAWAIANPLSNTYDNNTTYGAVTSVANIQNMALIRFNLPVIDATFIDYVQLNVGATAFGAGTWRLEGLDMSTNVWVSLSAAQAMNSANSNYVFTNTLQPNTRYYTYRILGVTSTNITDNARLTEFSIHYKNYNPSFHRTKMGCNSDGDNDGVPDYLDRDSDGDGCPDAVEAGIDKSLLLPSGFYNNGGTVNGDYVIVGGNYGDNGISDLVETTPDSGIVNYASTYHLYANNAAVNFCTDTDNDSIPDPIDIDDDNDGVLDAVESPSCFYTAAEANVIYRINSQFASPDDDQSDRDIQMLHDGSATANFNFNAFTVAENVTGSNLFTVEYYTPVRLATLVVSNRISTTANANAVVVGSQDGIMWSAALTPATLITAANATTPITFTITTAVPYKFYKIQTGSVPGALATANTIGEITSTVASGYIPSAHPKSEVCLVDTDGDLIPNHLDNDSDNDGCSDAFEAGTVTYASANGGTFSAGTLNNSSSTLSPNATVGSNTPADYGANGFYNVLETSGNGVYLGTYTYANAINASVASCSLACYKPAITAGTVLDTKQGITSLQRAGTDNSNWPMVRKGAWTALESKTKGFVPNRLTVQQIADIPVADLREGMMVYHIGLDCLYINTDGTPTGWKCFNTQTCP